MTWVYLSPHFDDVALSCGGLVWEQVQHGEPVSIWTMCAGEPPPGRLSPFARQLHARWQADYDAPANRRDEDVRSCRILGVSLLHFTLPDCIYRRDPITGAFMYTTEESLNGPLQSGDARVVSGLRLELKRLLPPAPTLICPLALGNHVDHQLTRQAAEGLSVNRLYYADFPYVLRYPEKAADLEAAGWSSRTYPISPPGLQAWQDSIAAHASQISTFWRDEQEMRQVVRDYRDKTGGIRLWTRPVV